MKSTNCAESLLFTALIALTTAACDGGDAPAPALAEAPAPYTNYLVFVADGVWNPADPSYTPQPLEEVQRELWGFDDEEIEAYAAKAAAFYLERFGVDILDPANAERVSVTEAGCDMRLAYRVVTMAGRAVPPEGWPLCSPGFTVAVTDPAGFELGGDWDGVLAPVGSSMTFGRYHIDTGDEPLIINFEAMSPYISDPFGNIVIRCAIDNPELGSGQANLALRIDQTTAGDISVQFRNVLTFDADGS